MDLKREKEAIIVEVEREQELLTNTLQKKLLKVSDRALAEKYEEESSRRRLFPHFRVVSII